MLSILRNHDSVDSHLNRHRGVRDPGAEATAFAVLVGLEQGHPPGVDVDLLAGLAVGDREGRSTLAEPELGHREPVQRRVRDVDAFAMQEPPPAALVRVLRPIGSGDVVNHDTYAADLGELRVRAERAGVETISIVLPSEHVEDRSAIWTDHVVTVRDSWAIVDELRAVIRSTRAATATR